MWLGIIAWLLPGYAVWVCMLRQGTDRYGEFGTLGESIGALLLLSIIFPPLSIIFYFLEKHEKEMRPIKAAREEQREKERAIWQRSSF